MAKKTESYLGNDNLKAAGIQVNFTEEQVKEYVKCAKDPIYFIKNYIKIVSLDKGLVPFELYDFQEDMVQKVHDNRFVIAKLPRQSGKSTTITAYILHYILFNQNMNVAILANKLSTAKELLHRLKNAYEYLPRWLQMGVLEWNKASIILENGSKVIASATSSSAVRGGSFNFIFLDEFAYVPQNVAEEFFSSVYPTISSGQETKVTIISTPHGMNMYYKYWTDAVNKRNSYIPIEVHWSDVPGRDEKWKAQTIANTSEEQFRTEFECDFIGSIHTLIASSKLKTLTFQNPIFKNDSGYKIYEMPKEGRTYVMCVDVSRGQGQDYHAFTIVDVTKPPYRLVASFRNNMLTPLLFPTIIHNAAKQFNNAHVLIEINDVGAQVADIMHHELEYENLLSATIRGRKGQSLDGGFGGGISQFGVRTTDAVKRIGCSILKSLVEEDKLIVEDFDVVRELFSFVSKKNSYEAEVGHHDDLVMTLVLFGWLSTQSYFKDLSDLDLRRDLYSERMKQLESDMTPFGIIDNGLDNDRTFRDSTGTVWETEYRAGNDFSF